MHEFTPRVTPSRRPCVETNTFFSEVTTLYHGPRRLMTPLYHGPGRWMTPLYHDRLRLMTPLYHGQLEQMTPDAGV
jgi:hypothetical protein